MALDWLTGVLAQDSAGGGPPPGPDLYTPFLVRFNGVHGDRTRGRNEGDLPGASFVSVAGASNWPQLSNVETLHYATSIVGTAGFRIQTSIHPDLKPGGDTTANNRPYCLEMWIRPHDIDASFTADRNLIVTDFTTGLSVERGFYLHWKDNGAIRLEGRDASQVIVLDIESAAGVIVEGTWQHIAIQRDGSQNWTIYVDGVSVATGTQTGNIEALNTGLTFGGWQHNTAHYAFMWVDSIRITRDIRYTGAFTPEEFLPERTFSGRHVYYDELKIGTPLAAWGFRRLISTYTGPLCRIRDTFDDSEQDVGQTSDGELGSFTVTGSPRVTTVYNQVDSDDPLIQPTASLQPELQIGAASVVSGRPQMKLDGADDFMVGTKLTGGGDDPLYAVAQPTWFLRGSGYGSGGETNGFIMSIPNEDAANTNPFHRLAIYRNGSSNDQIVFREKTTTSAHNPALRYSRSTSVLAYCFPDSRAVDFVAEYSAPGVNPALYPNPTRLKVGSNPLAGENPNFAYEEIVILDANASLINRNSLRTAIGGMFERNYPVDFHDTVLDMPFTNAAGFTDLSGRGLVARPMGSLAAPTSDYLDFNGTTDYAIIEQDAAFDFYADYEILVDVWFDALATNRRILWSHGGSAHQFGFILGITDFSSTELHFISGPTNLAASYIVTSGAGLVTGQWYTVRIIRTGAVVQLYVDGVLRGSRSSSNSPKSGAPLYLGSENGTTNFLDGRIRNLRMKWEN